MNELLLFEKVYLFYKQLYTSLRHINKRDRFTWGERCETMALDLLRLISKASYAPKPNRRILIIQASEVVDMLKIYIRLGDELAILDHKKYIAHEAALRELGRIIGGLIKALA